jgi:hypothetical protein
MGRVFVAGSNKGLWVPAFAGTTYITPGKYTRSPPAI